MVICLKHCKYVKHLDELISLSEKQSSWRNIIAIESKSVMFGNKWNSFGIKYL